MIEIPFIEAKHYRKVDGNRHPKVIVIHSMEAPEKGLTAENVANYFATTDRVASAHYNIDNNSIVQSVQCKDVAFAAPNMNRYGIHLEHAGYARQSEDDWEDEYSMAMLQLSARLCREILCPKFSIIPQWLGDASLRAIAHGSSLTGFCTHADVTRAFKTVGGHNDPGPGFPKVKYMNLVKGV